MTIAIWLAPLARATALVAEGWPSAAAIAAQERVVPAGVALSSCYTRRAKADP